MSANRAALVESIDKANKQTKLASNKAINLRLAKAGRPESSRIRPLVELASSLLKEAQRLARDKAFTDESTRLRTLDIAGGINFYTEVQRFETSLIKLALEQAGGNQARAARLLGLRATTLNSKIKVYEIQY